MFTAQQRLASRSNRSRRGAGIRAGLELAPTTTSRRELGAILLDDLHSERTSWSRYQAAVDAPRLLCSPRRRTLPKATSTARSREVARVVQVASVGRHVDTGDDRRRRNRRYEVSTNVGVKTSPR